MPASVPSCGGPSATTFSKATSATGWAAIIFASSFLCYSFFRACCCCSRGSKDSEVRRACQIPFRAYPLKTLLDSFRFAYAGGSKGLALGSGDGCLVLAYAPRAGGGFTAAQPILLRAGPTELDAPAPASWSSALDGRTHAGHFIVSTRAEADCWHVVTPDGRALNWRTASSAWSSSFPASLLVRGAPKDAPDLARGFSSRPLRRLVYWALIEVLGGYAAASIETSPASALWQATCRSWWQRALTRSLAAGVIVASFEYLCVAILPIAIERLPTKLFRIMVALAGLPALALALWGIAVNAQAGHEALRTSFICWAWTLFWVHIVLWPLLLLLSAGLWRDMNIASAPPACAPPSPPARGAPPARTADPWTTAAAPPAQQAAKAAAENLWGAHETAHNPWAFHGTSGATTSGAW